MINKDNANIILKLIDKNSLVLDIGGGRYPWFRANYILDKRKYEEKVGETVFIGGDDKKLEKKEYFNKDTWISHDFNNLPWPFEDNFFDFSLCMHTLEDLRDPIAICKEIQRVSKAGYISTPSRSVESCMGISGISKIYGYAHHRWFVESDKTDLIFTIKTPLLYQNKNWLIKDPRQVDLNYYWKDKFNYKETYLKTNKAVLKDIKTFYKKHQKWLQELKMDTIKNDLYNSWDNMLGEKPDFKNIAKTNYHPNKAIFFYKRLIKKINLIISNYKKI